MPPSAWWTRPPAPPTSSTGYGRSGAVESHGGRLWATQNSGPEEGPRLKGRPLNAPAHHPK
jgi:hypothetical protein